MSARRRAFTLLELLIVIGVLAGLVALAIPYYADYVGQAKLETMRSNLRAVKKAVIDFRADLGTYPLYIYELSTGSGPGQTVRYFAELPADPLSGSSDWLYVAPRNSAEFNAGSFSVRSRGAIAAGLPDS